jgi:Ecdysteroid kinase-like family
MCFALKDLKLHSQILKFRKFAVDFSEKENIVYSLITSCNVRKFTRALLAHNFFFITKTFNPVSAHSRANLFHDSLSNQQLNSIEETNHHYRKMTTQAEEIPLHLTEKFFEEILRKHHETKNIKVLNKCIQLATKPGDNFTSEIYRATVEYTFDGATQTISLVVKNMASLSGRDALLESLHVYERETTMYCHTLPAMSKLLHDKVALAAKCYHATDEPCKLLVFEDLQDSKFQMAAKGHGLDFDHCRMVLEKIGKFHATSMVVAQQQPDAMKIFNFGVFNPQQRNADLENFFVQGFATLADGVDHWSGFETIAKKLRRIQPDLLTWIYSYLDDDDTGFKVLNHGDLWMNNILFRYEGNAETSSPTDVIFVDYQASYYATPSYDLNYFLWISPSPQVRENHWTDLVEVYYKSLSETLTSLNAAFVPTFDDLMVEMKKKLFNGKVNLASHLKILKLFLSFSFYILLGNYARCIDGAETRHRTKD